MSRRALCIDVILHDARWKSRLRPHGKTVRAVCEAALSGFRIQDSGFRKKEGAVALSVVLADDAFVRDLNKTYRGKDKPTNVLSFPSFPESRIPNPETSLGDIVLAFDTVAREAKAQGKRFRDHAAHLIVHGCLHLAGHDHEEENEAEAMEALEIKILKKLGVENPYL